MLQRIVNGWFVRLLAVAVALSATLAVGSAAAGASGAHHSSGHATHKAHRAVTKRHGRTTRKARKTDRLIGSGHGRYAGSLRKSGVRSTRFTNNDISLGLRHNLYWGAEIGSQFTGTQSPWDMNAQNAFQSREAGGKKASMINLYAPFQQCDNGPCYDFGFPTAVFNNIESAGAIPMLSWGSDSLGDKGPSIGANGNYSLQSVANGADDGYLKQFAASAKAWGHRFFLRFDYEMNTGYISWGQSANGQSASQFVAAWKHVHDIFTQAGATNATWVWCPNVTDDAASGDFSSLYPGNSYVDWTCMDGYNYGGTNRWQSPDQVFQSSYDQITKLAPSKPVMIGETGSAEQGGSKSQWITQLLSELPTRYSKVAAFNWFDTPGDPSENMTIESSPAAQSAFQSGISNSSYQAGGANAVNSAADAPNGPIPAP